MHVVSILDSQSLASAVVHKFTLKCKSEKQQLSTYSPPSHIIPDGMALMLTICLVQHYSTNSLRRLALVHGECTWCTEVVDMKKYWLVPPMNAKCSFVSTRVAFMSFGGPFRPSLDLMTFSLCIAMCPRCCFLCSITRIIHSLVSSTI